MKESGFDGRLRLVGNSLVITIPKISKEKLKLKEREIVEVIVRKVSR